MKIKSLRLIALAAALLAAVSSALAQGTAFTYQGRLNDGAAPANGSYDLTFTLQSAASGAAQVGGLVMRNATIVSNGLFTVSLDFGDQFPGAERWLEIGVKTNGAAAFTSLAPRQALASVPYAVRAANAATALGVSGSVSASQISGTINSTMLAAGAAAANLNASGQAGVGSGGLVLSATENTALLNAGYVKLGTIQGGDTWQERATAAPAARYYHTAVWTGSEMIVWGGTDGGNFNDTFSYTPGRVMFLYQKP